jgi:hypothetical protein
MEHQGPDWMAAASQDAPERVAADQVASDQVASDQVASDQVASDQVAADQVASDQVVSEAAVVTSVATGEPRVDAALKLLERLPGLPVADHAELFEQVHAQLSEVLGELDAGSSGPAGA